MPTLLQLTFRDPLRLVRLEMISVSPLDYTVRFDAKSDCDGFVGESFTVELLHLLVELVSHLDAVFIAALLVFVLALRAVLIDKAGLVDGFERCVQIVLAGVTDCLAVDVSVFFDKTMPRGEAVAADVAPFTVAGPIVAGDRAAELALSAVLGPVDSLPGLRAPTA